MSIFLLQDFGRRGGRAGDFVLSMGDFGMVGVILLDWINVTILL